MFTRNDVQQVDDFVTFAMTQGHKGAFQFFASGNAQRIEIRWNNMLPSLWLLCKGLRCMAIGKTLRYVGLIFKSFDLNVLKSQVVKLL